MNKIKLFNQDCEILMPTLESGSIDIICIDPPYLYLKKQKLERPFDEDKFFKECKRLLTKNGFLIMFGRGESFYRWNTMVAGLGFKFKEEIVWDKLNCTSPLMNVSRVHETVSIWALGKLPVNKIKIPYVEIKSHDIPAIIKDIKRLKTAFGNPKSLEAVLQLLQNNANGIKNSFSEKTIIRADRVDREKRSKHGVAGNSKKDGNRVVDVMSGVMAGLNEKTIIRQTRDHYNTIHPTQKPVRLLERLLNLVIPANKLKEEVMVADFFGGSFSTMEAAYNLGLKGLASEIDQEYFESGKARIESLTPRQSSIFDLIKEP